MGRVTVISRVRTVLSVLSACYRLIRAKLPKKHYEPLWHPAQFLYVSDVPLRKKDLSFARVFVRAAAGHAWCHRSSHEQSPQP